MFNLSVGLWLCELLLLGYTAFLDSNFLFLLLIPLLISLCACVCPETFLCIKFLNLMHGELCDN